MNKSRIITGIDIGSSKIAVLIAQVPSEEEVNVIGVSQVASRGVKKGQIIDIEEASLAVIESVEKAERMSGYNADNLWVSVGGAHISSQNSHGVVAIAEPDGEVKEEDVRRVIEAASAVSIPSAREIIHVIPRNFTVDGESEVRDPVGMSGVRLETDTHIITGSATAIKNLKRCVSEIGGKTEEIVFSGIASAQSCLTDTEKELGVILADFGGGTVSLVVFIDGAIAHSAVLPIGAKNVTNDIAIGTRVSLEAAEKIKIALSERKGKEDKESDEIDLVGLGVEEGERKVSRKTLVEGIIKPRLNEIFTMIGLEIKDAGLAGKTPSGLVLTGGGALTVGAYESARRILSLPVRIAKPTGVTGLIDEIESPEWATVVGLVLWAAKASAPKLFSIPSFDDAFRKIPGKVFLNRFLSIFRKLLP